MADIIKNIATVDVSLIQLGEPVKLNGWYVAHASINGKPIVYQFPLVVAESTDKIVSFDLGEAAPMSLHIVALDQRLVAAVHENAQTFFGRKIRAETIEAAYASNAHDSKWTFHLSPELVVKDQFGNTLPPDVLAQGQTVTTFVELVGVSIGKSTIKPAWKLHKLTIYKSTVLNEIAQGSEPSQIEALASSSDDFFQPVAEAESFYEDVDESV